MLDWQQRKRRLRHRFRVRLEVDSRKEYSIKSTALIHWRKWPAENRVIGAEEKNPSLLRKSSYRAEIPEPCLLVLVQVEIAEKFGGQRLPLQKQNARSTSFRHV